MREFETGATRDDDASKIDPEGFMSPRVVKVFCQYMQRHRKQADGTMRDSDNWQKGIPYEQYLKSAWRHFLEVWIIHRGADRYPDLEEELCALKFNVDGMLHEISKERGDL